MALKKQGTLFGNKLSMKSNEPTLKDFIKVILVAAVLIATAWIAYYKFHLFVK